MVASAIADVYLQVVRFDDRRDQFDSFVQASLDCRHHACQHQWEGPGITV